MIELKAEGQDMNQATPEQGTDLHATPQRRNSLPKRTTLFQPSLHWGMGMGAVVIRHGQVG
jgi:hypothetical protein